jgi:hypothetical protein
MVLPRPICGGTKSWRNWRGRRPKSFVGDEPGAFPGRIPGERESEKRVKSVGKPAISVLALIEIGAGLEAPADGALSEKG